jgi:sigma-B regulation protein RsbU (phosphoserine phosphatase)
MSALPPIRRRLMQSEDVLAVSTPARTFTGDFYVTHRHEDRLWIALGDVAGKGLPAAIVMAMIQEELEHRIASCAETRCNPATTMGRLHEFLEPLLPNNRFATAVIAHLQDDGTLTIANGGHCPPLVVRQNGTIEEVSSTGPILGILPNAKWRSYTTHLAPGDSLLLYSDGVTESVVNGEELGVHGLRELVRKVGPCPRSLAAELHGVHDDMTLLVATRPFFDAKDVPMTAVYRQ